MLFPCNCDHPYQQEKYGDKRVHNPTIREGVYRCTACGRDNSKVLKKEKKK